MAKKVIKQEDLIEKGIFEEPIKQSEDLLAIIKSLKNEFKALAKVSLSNLKTTNDESAEGVKKLREETQKGNEAVKQYTKLEQEEIRLKKQLIDLEKEQAKEVARLKVQVAERNKELRSAAKESLKLEGAYARESKRLNDLRNKYKDLAAAGKANGVVARGINSEIKALDKTLKDIDASVGQYQRNVGNYASAFEKVADSTGVFSSELNTLKQTQQAVVAVFEVARDGLSKHYNALRTNTAATATQSVVVADLTVVENVNTVAVKTNEAATSKLTIVQKSLAASTALVSNGFLKLGKALLASGIGAVIVLLGVAVTSLTAFFKTFDEGQDAVSNVFSGIKASIGVIITAFAQVGERFTMLGTLLANQGKIILLGIEKIGVKIRGALTFTNVDKEISAIDKQIKELGKNDLGSLFDPFDGLGEKIRNAYNQGVLLNRELDQLEENARRLQIVVQELQALEDLYSQRAGDQTLGFKARAQAEKNLEKVQRQRLSTQLDLANKEFDLRARTIANEKSISVEELKNAVITQKAKGAIDEDSLKELLEFYLKTKEAKSELNLALEKQRQTERELEQKDARTRINLLRDTLTFEQFLLGKRLEQNKNSIFKQQVNLQEFERVSSEVFTRQIEIFQGQTKNFVDAEKLLGITSATELEEAIKALDLPEKQSQLLGDILLERKKAIEQISSEDEKLLRELEAKRKKFKLGTVNNEDEIKRNEKLAENEKLRLADQELGAKQQEADRLKRQKEERDSIVQTTELIISEINRRADAQLEANQKQIDSRKESIARQQELAEKGLDNTLEFEQKKLAEAELKQKELEEAKVRREKVIAYYKILQSSVLDGDPQTAPFKALATITASEAIAATLGGLFADGGYTGDGNGKKDSTGFKRAGIVHEGEYVIPKKILDTPMGAEIAETAERMRVGASPRYSVPIVSSQNLTMQNELIKIREAISKQKQVDVSWDSFDNRIEKIKVEAYTRTIKHVKKRSRI